MKDAMDERRTITLTTDFGLADTYIAQMKGVILGIVPRVNLVDVTHDLPPQDVLAGALAVESILEAFGPETIHLAVVDPGVGSSRRAIVIRTEQGCFVGPDNGLFTLVLNRTNRFTAVNLTPCADQRDSVSATFHGRDVFAPAAAQLAAGTTLEQLGPPVTDPVRLDLPQPTPLNGGLELHILHVDRFGNLVTDLTRDALPTVIAPETLRLQAGGTTITGLSRTYSDAPDQQPLAYFGSGGRLEVAVRNGNAASHLGLHRGDRLTLHTPPLN